MSAVAQPYVEGFRLATAAFAKGRAVLSEVRDPKSEAARPALQLGLQCVVSGLTQLEALARRYMSSPEAAGTNGTKPILGDPAFRIAASQCADALDQAPAYIGVAGKEIATTVRAWVGENDPAQAAGLSMLCDAAGRVVKTRAGRAA